MNSAHNMGRVAVVKFSRGSRFARYETAEGCEVTTLHTERGTSLLMSLEEAREHQRRLLSEGGWGGVSVTY